MSFDSYKGSIKLGAGLTPAGKGYPLMQSCDIQVGEDGKRLDALLAEILAGGVGPGINLDNEIAIQERLVQEIEAALLDKMGGVGISSIEKTSTDGLVDTYTITFTDGSTFEFTVTNGVSGSEIVTTTGADDKYEATVPSIKELTTGVSFVMIPHTTNARIHPTLNVNGFGTYYFKRSSVDDTRTPVIPSGWFTPLAPYTVMYDGKYWVLVDRPLTDANDIEGVVPVANGGVPIPEASSKRQVLTVNDEGTPEWQTPSASGGAGIKEITYIDTFYGDRRNVSANGGGVSWLDEFSFDTQEETEAARGDIYQRIPLVAGENVTFEVDEANQVVKINATGSGSGDSDGGVVGTWVFNDTIDALPEGHYAFEFATPNSNYQYISFGNLGPPLLVLFYGSGSEGTLAYSFAVEQQYGVSPGWQDDLHKTITVTNEPSQTIKDWLKANATQISAGDGGGTDNTILKVSVKTGYVTPMSDIITAIENVGGNSSDFNYVELYGYSEGLFLMQFHSMGSMYRVNCLDAVNGYKIYSEETQNVFVPSEKSIRDFLEEGTPKTMPVIRFVGMPCAGWLGEVDWEQVTSIHSITNENLKFTIEIVGGGALKEGDAIQLCHMAAYGACREKAGISKRKPAKRKLRRLFEYVITYEDLDKRFITFEIPYDADPKKMKRLTKWSTNGVNDKTIYFRVRRPKGELNSGPDQGREMTVDADFSNVVAVRMLSYTFMNDGAYFYHIRIT